MIYIVIILISAFIGWMTNYLAIKSLFRPRNKILFFQGIIPKRKKDIIYSFVDVLLDEVFSDKVCNNIIGQIYDEKTKDLNSLFFFDEFLKEIRSDIIVYVSDGLKRDEIRQIVFDRLNDFDDKKIEKIIYKCLRKELKFVEFMGAILGFIIGLIQVLLFWSS